MKGLQDLWGMVMYDNEFQTKENKTLTKDKIDPQHTYCSKSRLSLIVRVNVVLNRTVVVDSD